LPLESKGLTFAAQQRVRLGVCKYFSSIVDASTVNAFKARLDKFWSHQAVKFDFTAVLTGTGNRSEELKKL